jgi:hypothetical protein
VLILVQVRVNGNSYVLYPIHESEKIQLELIILNFSNLGVLKVKNAKTLENNRKAIKIWTKDFNFPQKAYFR